MARLDPTSAAAAAIGEAENLAILYGGVPRDQIDPGMQPILDKIASGEYPQVPDGAMPGYTPPVIGAENLVQED